MTVQAKAIVNAFYGSAPRRAYWIGCSSGGQAGPQGSAAIPGRLRRHRRRRAGEQLDAPRHAEFVGRAGDAQGSGKRHPAARSTRSFTTPPLAQCDANDGVRDGVIENPDALPVRSEDASVRGRGRTIMPDGAAGGGRAEDLRRREESAHGPGHLSRASAVGSETGGPSLAGGPRPFGIADDHFKFVVFKNPEWDFRTLDFDKDLELADRIDRDFGLTPTIRTSRLSPRAREKS